MKQIIIILFRHFYLFQNDLDPWSPRGCHFTKKTNAILHKMVNSGFWNFGLIFLRSTFFSCNTFLYLWLSVWVDICIINFGNEGVRELAGPFQRSKPCGISKISNGFKISFFPMENIYFTQFINKFLQLEEMKYVNHRVKVKMWPALCNFPILFSAVKFKSGHNFSQLIYRFKIGNFDYWTWSVLRCFSQFTKGLKIGVLECCSSYNC